MKMHFFEKKGLKWGEFPLFSPFKKIKHASFTRKGGVSTVPFDSLNIGRSTADLQENIEKNFKKIESCLEIPSFYEIEQIHSNQVVKAEKNKIFQADGVVTSEKNLPLLIKHADCQAALFYDPVKEVIGAVHAGWKGNVTDIYQETVNFFKTHYGSDPKDIYVAISPSLGPQSSQFIHFEKEFPESFHSFQVKPFYFDLWAIARFQLEKAGILSSHIEIASIDTYTNPEDYFSYRKNPQTGRVGTFIMLT